MLKKKTKRFFRNIFHAKRVLIVTDKGVDYYPLGKISQLFVFLGIIGFVSWASYSTGSFMAAETQIQEKNRRIAEVDLKNRDMETQFSLLRQDLLRMQGEQKKEMNEYTKFIIDQYASDSMAGVKNLAYNQAAAPASNGGMVMERIQFLEGRVEQLKQENHDLVEAVRYQTRDKIAEFQGIINGTGLSSRTLEQRKAELEETLSPSDEAEGETKGGPFIPESLLNVDRVEELFASLDQLMGLYDILGQMPLNKPIANSRLTSGFGRRLDPFNHRPAMHTGSDFMAPMGSKVVAANDGTVLTAGREGAYGNMVDIDHGLGITTRYGHMSRVLVKAGQKVKKGDAIGIQGSTGRSTGQHLHYEVRYNDAPLDPMRFLNAGKKIDE